VIIWLESPPTNPTTVTQYSARYTICPCTSSARFHRPTLSSLQAYQIITYRNFQMYLNASPWCAGRKFEMVSCDSLNSSSPPRARSSCPILDVTLPSHFPASRQTAVKQLFCPRSDFIDDWVRMLQAQVTSIRISCPQIFHWRRCRNEPSIIYSHLSRKEAKPKPTPRNSLSTSNSIDPLLLIGRGHVDHSRTPRLLLL